MLLLRLCFTGVNACVLLVFLSHTIASAESMQMDKPAVVMPSGASSSISLPTGDMTLPAFIRQIWTESPAVQAALAEMDAAQARFDGADLPLHNPSLELDAERTNISTSSVGVSQTLDWSDKRGSLTNIAKQEQMTARAVLNEARRNTALETLNALVDYATANELQVLSRHRTKLLQSLVNAAKQRQAAGDVQALDVTLAKVAYSEALMAQSTAESEMIQADTALQSVSGVMSSGTNVQWPSLSSQLDIAPMKKAISGPTSFEQLPQLAILRSRMNTAKARVTLAKKVGRVEPTIGIRAGQEDSETLFGLSLEIPLFVRNNFKAEARVASAEAVVEEQRYREAYRRAKALLTGALARHQNTSRAWESWLALGLQAQQEQMSLLDQLWTAGELSVTDYLIQAKQNIDTREAAVHLMGEARRAHFAWLAASNQVESWLGLAQHDIETYSGELK